MCIDLCDNEYIIPYRRCGGVVEIGCELGRIISMSISREQGRVSHLDVAVFLDN